MPTAEGCILRMEAFDRLLLREGLKWVACRRFSAAATERKARPAGVFPAGHAHMFFLKGYKCRRSISSRHIFLNRATKSLSCNSSNSFFRETDEEWPWQQATKFQAPLGRLASPQTTTDEPAAMKQRIPANTNGSRYWPVAS